MILRTYPAALLVLLAPALAADRARADAVSIAGGWGGQKAAGVGATSLRWLPRLLRERRAIQARRADRRRRVRAPR